MTFTISSRWDAVKGMVTSSQRRLAHSATPRKRVSNHDPRVANDTQNGAAGSKSTSKATWCADGRVKGSETWTRTRGRIHGDKVSNPSATLRVFMWELTERVAEDEQVMKLHEGKCMQH